MNVTSFGTKIYNLRKEKNLTQAQLADILNISPKTISRWETGEGYPEISILKPLADALGVSVDSLLSDEEKEPQGTIKQEKKYRHYDIPVDWSRVLHLDFWRSLTIFNKISYACVLIQLFTLIVFNLVYILFNMNGYEMDTLPFFLSSINGIIYTFAPKIGLTAAVIGLIAGILDLYDRQIKTSIILCIVNIVIYIVLPLILIIILRLLTSI